MNVCVCVCVCGGDGKGRSELRVGNMAVECTEDTHFLHLDAVHDVVILPDAELVRGVCMVTMSWGNEG